MVEELFIYSFKFTICIQCEPSSRPLRYGPTGVDLLELKSNNCISHHSRSYIDLSQSIVDIEEFSPCVLPYSIFK